MGSLRKEDKMIQHMRITEERGDATAKYSVIFNRKYTVKEFVDELLTERNGTWGNLCIAVDPEKPYKLSNPGFWYNRGKVEKPEVYEQVLDEYGDRYILKAEGDGGWSRMDYTIWLEEEEEKAVNDIPEQKEADIETSPEPNERRNYENTRARKHRRK